MFFIRKGSSWAVYVGIITALMAACFVFAFVLDVVRRGLNQTLAEVHGSVAGAVVEVLILGIGFGSLIYALEERAKTWPQRIILLVGMALAIALMFASIWGPLRSMR